MTNKLVTLRYFAETRWIKHYRSRAQIVAFQERMLKRHLAFLRSHSPYYKQLAPIDSLAQLSRLPMMDKASMMANFDQMNTLGLQRDQALAVAIKSEKTRNFRDTYDGISVGLSSGTSGHRGLFVVTDRERAAWAGAVLAKLLPRYKLFGHRIAFFLRADNNLYQTVGSRLLRFEYFDIYRAMTENLQRLGQYQPTVLVAPPSVLSVIADAVAAGTLQLGVQKVISVAEVLTVQDEARFRRVFNQPIIFQVYQCTEGFLAATCHSGSLHLNEDIVIIEKDYLGERRFAPIITDFRRTSQPIIRYRLNDVLVEAGASCSCGSATTIIERIEGREDDIFLFRNKRGQEVRIFSDMISRCMTYVAGVKQYRVVQASYDKIVIFLEHTDDGVRDRIVAEFQQLANKMSFNMPTISYEPYKIDLSKKLKRVERQF